jgi:hypothetical protein
MDRYVPKLFHAVLLVLAAFGLFIAAANFLPDDQFAVASIVSGILVLFSFVVMAWISNQERIAFYDAITRFSDSIRNLEQDQWLALGIRFPSIRIKWDGKPLKLLEDTDITIPELERFMKDSDPTQISPRRNWGNGRDGRVWEKIKRWLYDNNYIRHDSASGNHSYLWRGQAYFQIMERYLQVKVIDDPGLMTGAPTSSYTGPLETSSGQQKG